LGFLSLGRGPGYKIGAAVKEQHWGLELYVVWGPLLLDWGVMNFITVLCECKIKKEDDYSNCGNGWYKISE